MGGGEPSNELPPPGKPAIVVCCKEPLPICAGGGTAVALPKPATARVPVMAPFNCAGGGTTAVLPMPLKPRCVADASAIEDGGEHVWTAATRLRHILVLAD